MIVDKTITREIDRWLARMFLTLHGVDLIAAQMARYSLRADNRKEQAQHAHQRTMLNFLNVLVARQEVLGRIRLVHCNRRDT